MRRFALIALLLCAASVAFAQQPPVASTFEFEPPEPDSATNVQLHIGGINADGCVPRTYTIVRNGNDINVVFDPLPENTGCILIFVPWAQRVDLGRLAPGTYSVHASWSGSTLFEGHQLVVTSASQPIEIDPPISPTTGGATVAMCCTEPKSITFDGIPATFQRNGSTATIVTPPHAAGPAVVKIVRESDNAVITFSQFRYYDPSAAPDPSTFAKVLFPTFYNGPGAEGSQWRSTGLVEYDHLGNGNLAAWRRVTLVDVQPLAPTPIDTNLSRATGFFFFPARRQSARINYDGHRQALLRGGDPGAEAGARRHEDDGDGRDAQHL